MKIEHRSKALESYFDGPRFCLVQRGANDPVLVDSEYPGSLIGVVPKYADTVWLYVADIPQEIAEAIAQFEQEQDREVIVVLP